MIFKIKCKLPFIKPLHKKILTKNAKQPNENYFLVISTDDKDEACEEEVEGDGKALSVFMKKIYVTSELLVSYTTCPNIYLCWKNISTLKVCKSLSWGRWI